MSIDEYFSFKSYQDTFEYLNSHLPLEYRDSKLKIGVVCGSGLGGLADLLEAPICSFDYKDIPYFGVSSVQGHSGKLVFGKLAGQPTCCMVGRKHVYEGHSIVKTVFPIRVMKLLGISLLITTNAAGGLNADFNVGDIMVIGDHISFPGFGGQNPLIGPNIPEFGDRFPAVSDAYDFDLRTLAFKAASEIGLDMHVLREGVYGYVMGPSFETRAEARFLRTSGADVVGMSTVPEVIAARHCGIKVLGISLVTNKVSQSVGKSAREAWATAANKDANPINHKSDHKDLSSKKKLKLDSPVKTKISKANLVNAKDSLLDDSDIVANHHEVLETGRQRSQDMQKLVHRIVEIVSDLIKI